MNFQIHLVRCGYKSFKTRPFRLNGISSHSTAIGLILGARQVGKTTILQHVLPDSVVFDLENQSHYERIHADVSFFLNQQETPLIIDEAQLSGDRREFLFIKCLSGLTYLFSGLPTTSH